MTPQSLLETVIYAVDLSAAERFYRDVVGLELVTHEVEHHLFFRCGQGMLLIFNPEKSSTQHATAGGALIPRHGATGPVHVAFRVRDDELPRWRTHLITHGVPIETEITWPQGGHSLYFRDPAGNSVELAASLIWKLPELP